MIVLIGFMGAGKTTVGRALAARLRLPFLDSDQVIEKKMDLSVADIFEGYGEAAFRAIEADTVAGLLAGPETVLALGGGAVMTARTRLALAGHTVVHLAISLDDALARVGRDPGRPVLRNPELASLFAARAAVYADVATITVPAGRPPKAVVDELVQRLRDARPDRPDNEEEE